MPRNTNITITEHVTACLQLAILLEINVPKPGNIHPNANFQKTRYEHFLASTVAIAPSLKKAASRGIKIAENKISFSQAGVGRLIKDAVERIDAWQHGGNTLLGTIILLTPIAIAAGKALRENNMRIDMTKLRRNIKSVVTATTPKDAVALYEAIDIAKPGGLNTAPAFDATQDASKQQILDTNTTLFDLFKISAAYDSVSSEWTNDYAITFDIAYPFLKKEITKRRNINQAVVHTFLEVLSEIPDTLIARKVGITKAREISKQAKDVLAKGGFTSNRGREALREFDKNLRDADHKLNPGTTADLITATLALHILNGYRP